MGGIKVSDADVAYARKAQAIASQRRTFEGHPSSQVQTKWGRSIKRGKPRNSDNVQILSVDEHDNKQKRESSKEGASVPGRENITRAREPKKPIKKQRKGTGTGPKR